RDALALWRGPTLAGLLLESHGRDEVAQLDELRLTALMDRIDCDLVLGRHEDVLGELHMLVGEHPLRERLRAQQILALYRADRQVVAVCEDLDSLLAAVEAERPDVVVTDIRMPPGNLDEGIRAADRLRVEHPDVGVVVLSQYLEPAYALALFEAGTERRAYLL